MVGTGLTGGLAGCSEIGGSSGLAPFSRSSAGEVMDLLAFLPPKYHDGKNPDFSFSLIGPTAALNAKPDLGEHKTAAILRSTVGEAGWIEPQEIDQQLYWHEADGSGYAFVTTLGREEILRRYRESVLQERPSGSYNGYTLIERSNSWHAIGDGVVAKIPKRELSRTERHLDGTERFERSSMGEELRAGITELDTEYQFSAAIAGGTKRTLSDSAVQWQGLFHAFSPYPDGQGFTLSTGIYSETPDAVTAWAENHSPMFFGDLVHRDPEIRANDGLILLTESGTAEFFSTYK